MPQTTYSGVATASDLSADITAIDLASQASGGTIGTAYVIQLTPGATLTESADIAAINLSGSDTLTISGSTGATLDGGGAFRGFFVYNGTVTLQNLTIQNTVAKGGAGGSVSRSSMIRSA